MTRALRARRGEQGERECGVAKTRRGIMECGSAAGGTAALSLRSRDSGESWHTERNVSCRFGIAPTLRNPAGPRPLGNTATAATQRWNLGRHSRPKVKNHTSYDTLVTDQALCDTGRTQSSRATRELTRPRIAFPESDCAGKTSAKRLLLVQCQRCRSPASRLRGRMHRKKGRTNNDGEPNEEI